MAASNGAAHFRHRWYGTEPRSVQPQGTSNTSRWSPRPFPRPQELLVSEPDPTCTPGRGPRTRSGCSAATMTHEPAAHRAVTLARSIGNPYILAIALAYAARHRAAARRPCRGSSTSSASCVSCASATTQRTTPPGRCCWPAGNGRRRRGYQPRAGRAWTTWPRPRRRSRARPTGCPCSPTCRPRQRPARGGPSHAGRRARRRADPQRALVAAGGDADARRLDDAPAAFEGGVRRRRWRLLRAASRSPALRTRPGGAPAGVRRLAEANARPRTLRERCGS